MISNDNFRKSSFSGTSGCVEVRHLPDGRIALRDSKDMSLPPHYFTAVEWTAFLAGVRAGEFDLDDHARTVSRSNAMRVAQDGETAAIRGTPSTAR